MTVKKRVVVPIQRQLLELLLKLPSGCHVSYASWDIMSETLQVYLEGEGVPYDQFPGCAPVSIVPVHEQGTLDLTWPEEMGNG
jgi:hypothetical protein